MYICTNNQVWYRMSLHATHLVLTTKSCHSFTLVVTSDDTWRESFTFDNEAWSLEVSDHISLEVSDHISLEVSDPIWLRVENAVTDVTCSHSW